MALSWAFSAPVSRRLASIPFSGWDLLCIRWQLTMALIPPQLPILLKGTSDDDIPCPGYLFEEIASILLHHSHWWGILTQQGKLLGKGGVFCYPKSTNNFFFLVYRLVWQWGSRGLKLQMPVV